MTFQNETSGLQSGPKGMEKESDSATHKLVTKSYGDSKLEKTPENEPSGRPRRGLKRWPVQPIVPESVTCYGDECRNCWTKGHHRRECPYRRYRHTKADIRNRNLVKSHEAGLASGGSGYCCLGMTHKNKTSDGRRNKMTLYFWTA